MHARSCARARARVCVCISDGVCASQVVRGGGGAGDGEALKGTGAQGKLSKPERQLVWSQTEESFRQDAVFEPTFDAPYAQPAEEDRASSAVKAGHAQGAEPA